ARPAEGVIDFTHTFVDEALRGQGVADELARAALAFARAQHLKVKTSCTFMKGFVVVTVGVGTDTQDDGRGSGTRAAPRTQVPIPVCAYVGVILRMLVWCRSPPCPRSGSRTPASWASRSSRPGPDEG
ncbi:MAG: hypothetical protein EON52_08315, partial [Actinomycetales bacterium]